MRILIVDDEPFVIDMLKLALEQMGHSVLTVTFYEEIALLAGSHHFDAVILDYSMPYENGWTILQRLRESTPWDFPFVFYTKSAQGSGEWEALQREGVPPHKILQKADTSEDARALLTILRGR